jgi:iron complex outermembrane receptor protein
MVAHSIRYGFLLLLLAPPSLASAQEAPAPVTPAAGAPSPATAPPSGLGNVNDFGNLDLEMTTVSDFNQLDLEALLDAKVETASKKSESISRAPAIIEVLTREQIYNLGARDLYSALTFLPGIEIIENYSGTSTMVFRGAPQEQYSVKILFMINGHPIFEPISSSFLLETVPFEAIKRIEVIRGPGSVLYGTNAFAGVINVITETAKEDGVHTVGRLEGGQFTTASGGAGNYGRKGDFAWGVFAGGNQTRGFPYRIHKDQNEDCIPGSPSGAPLSQLRPYDCLRPGLSGTLEYFNNYKNAMLDLQYSGLRLQAGGVMQEKQKYGLLPNLRFNGTNETNHFFGELSYRHDWGKLGIVARTGWNHHDLRWDFGRFPLPTPQFRETHTEGDGFEMFRGELTVSWAILDNLSLDQGISYDTSKLKSFYFLFDNGAFHPLANVFEDYSQDTESYYAQARWDITEALTLIGGFRVSQFETDTLTVVPSVKGAPTFEKGRSDPILIPSPRVSLIYTPRDEITFKALYGEAFRLPNLFETAGTLSGLIASTPNIQPEKIRTAELGADTRPLQWLTIRGNVYYSALSDLISRRNARNAYEQAQLGNSNAGGLYDNVYEGHIVGAEFSSLAVFSETVNGFFNISWKTTDIGAMEDVTPSTGPVRMPMPAAFTANIGASWKAMPWIVLRPNAQYIGARGYSKAYTLVNGVVDFPVTKEVTLSAIGNNLFNTDYTYPEAVRRYVKTLPGGPGRAYYGRITAEF